MNKHIRLLSLQPTGMLMQPTTPYSEMLYQVCLVKRISPVTQDEVDKSSKRHSQRAARLAYSTRVV